MKWSPTLPKEPADYTPWTWKELLVAGIVAILLMAIVGVVFVAPAEAGRDPTGLGERMRLTELSGGAPEAETPEPTPPTNITKLQSFEYNWTTTNRLLAERTGNLAEGESSKETIAVTDLNVTRITAILTWQDNATVGEPEPDTFQLEIDGPAGSNQTSGSNEGASGRIETAVLAAPVPDPSNVTAADETSARDAIALRHPADGGSQGDWEFTITLTDVADLIGDDGSGWKLQVFIETYELVLGEGESTFLREATVTIPLEAFGGDIEYKVFILEGDSMTYEWSADGDVYWDFHGIQNSGAETSHQEGTSDGEEGSFTAPFNGRHGWYWRNDGAQAVEITLTVRGAIIPPA